MAYTSKKTNHETIPSSFWWTLSDDWVEEPNIRRNGVSGVQRIRTENDQLFYAKHQTNHTHRSFKHPLGRLTILRENEALIAATKAGVSVPEIAYCGIQKDSKGTHGVLVTYPLENYETLEEWFEQDKLQKLDETTRSQVLIAIATQLARLHHARLQHNCIYPKHIFIQLLEENGQITPQIALIDLEKCRRRLTVSQASLHDMRQFRRHLKRQETAFTDKDWEILLQAYQQKLGTTVSKLATL